MLERVLEFKVLNVKQLKHDSMVGFFKMDLGIVYFQPNHCYEQKWLVLVSTENGTKVHTASNSVYRELMIICLGIS